MKIEDVLIINWRPPGDKWWDGVASKPDEPLIRATITMTLSHNEYSALLDSDEKRNENVLKCWTP